MSEHLEDSAAADVVVNPRNVLVRNLYDAQANASTEEGMATADFPQFVTVAQQMAVVVEGYSDGLPPGLAGDLGAWKKAVEDEAEVIAKEGIAGELRSEMSRLARDPRKAARILSSATGVVFNAHEATAWLRFAGERWLLG